MSAKLSDSRKRANQKWDAENLKRISVAMLLDDYNAMMEHIEKKGSNRNKFINHAIRTTIALENQNDNTAN